MLAWSCRWVQGAFYGGLLSLLVILYVGIMAQLTNQDVEPLPTSLAACECTLNTTADALSSSIGGQEMDLGWVYSAFSPSHSHSILIPFFGTKDHCILRNFRGENTPETFQNSFSKLPTHRVSSEKYAFENLICLYFHQNVFLFFAQNLLKTLFNLYFLFEYVLD